MYLKGELVSLFIGTSVLWEAKCEFKRCWKGVATSFLYCAHIHSLACGFAVHVSIVDDQEVGVSALLITLLAIAQFAKHLVDARPIEVVI